MSGYLFTLFGGAISWCAKKAEAEEVAKSGPIQSKKDGDDMNWFGVKVGSEVISAASGTGGVGKYLNSKRPATGSASQADPPKKRKLGFGNFDNF